MNIIKKVLSFILAITILLITVPFSYATEESQSNDFSDKYYEALNLLFLIDGDEYPNIDISDTGISEFVQSWVNSNNGSFSADNFRNAFIYPYWMATSADELYNKLPQLKRTGVDLYIVYSYRRFYLLTFKPELWDKTKELSFIERVYLFGNLYNYLLAHGFCYITFDTHNSQYGVIGDNYTEYKRDVNFDENFNGKDILYLRKYLTCKVNRINLIAADQNGDGVVGIKDLLLLKRAIADN